VASLSEWSMRRRVPWGLRTRGHNTGSGRSPCGGSELCCRARIACAGSGRLADVQRAHNGQLGTRERPTHVARRARRVRSNWMPREGSGTLRSHHSTCSAAASRTREAHESLRSSVARATSQCGTTSRWSPACSTITEAPFALLAALSTSIRTIPGPTRPTGWRSGCWAIAQAMGSASADDRAGTHGPSAMSPSRVTQTDGANAARILEAVRLAERFLDETTQHFRADAR
jgi:hypothetical protein